MRRRAARLDTAKAAQAATSRKGNFQLSRLDPSARSLPASTSWKTAEVGEVEAELGLRHILYWIVGTRVTAFAAGPGVAGGRIANAYISVTDVAPTLLDFADLRQPANFAGHTILPMQGHSLAPVLNGGQADVRQPTEAVGTELFYRRALRKGDWKAVYLPASGSAYPRKSVGTDTWQLFNIARDPAEAHDLAATEPRKLQELIADWNSYATEKGVVLPAPASAAK